MGAGNTVFEDRGEERMSLTYMAGALVKLGHSLALAVRGRGHVPSPERMLMHSDKQPVSILESSRD
jgi:uncharacterized membrane protein YoaK (UPF0700 family)